MARASKSDDSNIERAKGEAAPNAVWFKPLMVGFLVVGLAWVIVFYISGDKFYPIPAIGTWNLWVGLGIAMIGFLMTTRWR